MFSEPVGLRKLVHAGRRFLTRIRIFPEVGRFSHLKSPYTSPVRLFFWYPVELQPHVLALDSSTGRIEHFIAASCSVEGMVSAAKDAVSWLYNRQQVAPLSSFPLAVQNQGFKNDRIWKRQGRDDDGPEYWTRVVESVMGTSLDTLHEEVRSNAVGHSDAVHSRTSAGTVQPLGDETTL
ncbi:MAG: hypothetical protein KVP17_002358 [Porospora cf. gigantea B]|uniref:uncharacterized protein n=1 Tax=Porospora cf. gigantea B TaxID=2853592 RepID=UPI003571F2A9|nr:MAG: hypothetical protein KVP17_002358 [Porospora cf. gigantea B]